MILKTVPVTKNMADFDFLALYDEMKFAGFMAVRKYENMTDLFFLAIDSENRSCGYGSRAIETLKALYPNTQQVVDLEMLDKNADNAVQSYVDRNIIRVD